MSQVKIKFRLKIFNLGRLILNYFLCFLALIIHELGLRDKGNWESTKVKSKLTLQNIFSQIWPVKADLEIQF